MGRRLIVRLQKSFVKRHRMTQLVELNPRLGAARKMQQHTATHFCFWKKPTMFLCQPHPLPYSKAVALLPRILRARTRRRGGVLWSGSPCRSINRLTYAHVFGYFRSRTMGKPSFYKSSLPRCAHAGKRPAV
jgi:hypothetical protein